MQAGITMARGAVLLRTPAMRERVTVMVLVMAVTTMDTEAARETSSVAPTTVSSLELTTIPRYYHHYHYYVIIIIVSVSRMTAVRGLRACLWLVVPALAMLDSSNLVGIVWS